MTSLKELAEKRQKKDFLGGEIRNRRSDSYHVNCYLCGEDMELLKKLAREEGRHPGNLMKIILMRALNEYRRKNSLPLNEKGIILSHFSNL